MDFKYLLFSQVGAIAIVQLNRPDSFNAFNMDMFHELNMAIDQISKDDTIRVLVIKGNEKFFGVGADLREVINYDSLEIRNYIEQAHAMGYKLIKMKKPSIASISGFCLGGGLELSIGCDIRIASDTAMFGLPEVNLGVFPAGGGTQRLARIIGNPKARELILTGDIIDNKQALEIGLINNLVPQAELEETTMKLARKLSRKPPLAIEMIKELMDISEHLDPAIGTYMEREKFSVLFSSQDKNEGMNAFLEGRRPVFKGK
ncbi:MAG TPA: enoyl-CoA hydratase/isomerase family protein [Syntrophomonadaceae bacterium]|nr:enoyl-CoA hydratase/isomerase family protein [Syntrophomonadaceae bacterium]